MSDGVLITAGGMAPLEFAREIFAALAIYDEDALESWYRLYKTGKSEHYARLARELERRHATGGDQHAVRHRRLVAT